MGKKKERARCFAVCSSKEEREECVLHTFVSTSTACVCTALAGGAVGRTAAPSSSFGQQKDKMSAVLNSVVFQRINWPRELL